MWSHTRKCVTTSPPRTVGVESLLSSFSTRSNLSGRFDSTINSSSAFSLRRFYATTNTTTTHEELVKKEFASQAKRGFDVQTASSKQMIDWICSALPPLSNNFRVLDVAAGTGRMSRAVADKVKEVVAVDLTAEMMEVGKESAINEGHQNIQWIQADARKIPLPSESFDMVVTRLAVHHWPQPQPIFNEMARLCKKGGKVVVVDIILPDDLSQEEKERVNYYEILRDPSHAAFVEISQLQGFFRNATPRLQLVQQQRKKEEGVVKGYEGIVDSKDNINPLENWLNLTNPKEAARKEIVEAIERDLQGQHEAKQKPSWRSGMKPFKGADGKIYFPHRYVVAEADRV